jgi:hypothetical protein
MSSLMEHMRLEEEDKNYALIKKLKAHLKRKNPSEWFYFIDGFCSIPLHLQM